MSCRYSQNCVYYRTARFKVNQKQHKLLVESYCEGNLHVRCRRVLYEADFGIEAPEDLAPNGYLVGTNKKQKVENTRRFKRYKVSNGVCLVQLVGTQKTFSAWINDVSEGGLQLEVSIDPQDLGTGEKSCLKIMGHSLNELPFPLSSEIVQPVWQNQKVFGCSFVSHPTR